ncbi:MAG: kelch repeat-containing protein [Myxococcaceae bacterium]|nr:MAG: kelch repeat-containing protein [Myxococcaceae bacterium]
MRREWWSIAVVVAALSCGTSGGGMVGDGGTGTDGGTVSDGGPDAGPDAGGDAGPDGGTVDGGTPGPDGGPPDGGSGGLSRIEWTTLEDRPLGTSEGQGAVVNGKLYTFGGFDWSKACCTPWRYAFVYDLATDTWSRLADMPEGVTHAGVATDGTDVFWVGGFVEDASRTFQVFGTVHAWRYRVATNTYEALPDLPDRRGGGTLTYLDGKLHFIGGLSYGQASDTNQHWVLDVAGGATAWTSAAPLPTPRNHLGSAVVGGKIYVIGGQHGHDEGLVTVPDVEIYDPGTDTWTRGASMPRARSHITGGTFPFRDRIVVISGEIANGRSISDVTAYDPIANAWSELTPLPAPRFSGVGGPIGNGFVYTTGDFQQTTFFGVPVP